MARTKKCARRVGGKTRDVQTPNATPPAAPGGPSKKAVKAKIKAKAKAKHAAKMAKKQLKAAENASPQDDDEEDELSDDGFIVLDEENDATTNGQKAVTANGDEDEEGEVDDGSSVLMNASMPWMGSRTGYYNPNLYVSLHDEIVDFVRFMSPSKEEIERRAKLVTEIREVVVSLWAEASLETFGSHETQMFLPNSDIDMVVFGVRTGTAPLFELAQRLEELDMVSYLEVIDKARIPIVKFVHKASNIHVDISFNIGGGLATAALVKHYMRVFPAFRPITLVLKYFLAQRGLNETFSGGIGSFLVQLMVVSFLQHYRRNLGAEHDDPKYNNLGRLLVGFFTLYGRDLNYNDVGLSVRDGGSYFRKEDRQWYDDNRPFLISVENPNEPSLDIGKNSYEIRTVKRSFDYARQVLTNEIHRRGQFQPLAGTILGAIIPADSHLLDRDAPTAFGFEVLHHDPKKTAAIKRQYEARCEEEKAKKAEESAAKGNRNSGGRRQQGNEPPSKRWRGRTSRNY